MNNTDAPPTERKLADWALLSHVCQAYRALSDELMDEIAMHRAQAGLLCRLYVADGMTQSDLAEQLAVQGATMTNMLQRMEEAGLVTRRRDDDDNRLVRVRLTEAGRERERDILKQFAKLERTVFEGLSEAERAALRGMLRRMLSNMEGMA
jgi:DNA-binding MarR family transcriptional regulator